MKDVLTPNNSLLMDPGYQGSSIESLSDIGKSDWRYQYGHPDAAAEAILHEKKGLPPYTIVPKGTFMACDAYSIFCIACCLVPAIFVYFVNLFNGFLIWPVMLIYMNWGGIVDEWDRYSFHWMLFCAYTFVVGLPMILVNIFYILFLAIFIVISGVPFTLLNSRARNAFWNNWKLLRPFLGSPGTYITRTPTPRHDLAKMSGIGISYFDVMLSMMAQLDRQGLLEVMRAWPQNMAMTPLFRYFCVCNPFLHELQNVFMNQWTEVINADWDEDLDQNDLEVMKEFLIKMTIDQRNSRGIAKIIGAWPFIGIYPRPPKGRKSRTVNGIQFCSKKDEAHKQCGTMKNSLITTTFHSAFLEDNVCRSDIANSEHGHLGCVVVYLQFWNPYHFCVGEVEVNVRTDFRAEHPMWLVTDPKCWMGPYIMDLVNRVFGNLVFLLGRLISNVNIKQNLDATSDSVVVALAEEAKHQTGGEAWDRALASREGKPTVPENDTLMTTEDRREHATNQRERFEKMSE